MLAASQCRVKELEMASHHSNSRLASDRIGSIGAQNDAEAWLLDLHVNPIDRCSSPPPLSNHGCGNSWPMDVAAALAGS